MEKSNFDQLLERYLTGQVSEEERVKIEMWLELMKTENTDDLELSEEDEEKLFQKIISKQDNSNEIKTLIPHRKPASVSWLTGVAATLLILIVASFAIWYFLPNDQISFFTYIQTDKVILEDGTLVWLDQGSDISFKNLSDKGIRLATLTGSGLFEVAKDPEHPFIIQSGDITVKVVGTSFRINTQESGFELIVLTGKVEVTTPDSTIHELFPNERFNLVDGSLTQQNVLSAIERKAITNNTEYYMEFSNASLKEVLHKLERKFDIEIKLESKQVSNCRITADLTDHSLVSSLERISDVIDIQFEVNDNSVMITGNGCK